MKVLFTTPHTFVSGGTKVIFRYAAQLHDRNIPCVVLSHKRISHGLVWFTRYKSKFEIIDGTKCRDYPMHDVTHIVDFCDAPGILSNPFSVPHILLLQGFGGNQSLEISNLKYRFKHVIAVSEWLKDIALKFSHKNITLIPPGVDSQFTDLGFKKDYDLKKYCSIGCLFHEAPSKNIKLAIDVFNMLSLHHRINVLFLSSKIGRINEYDSLMKFEHSFIVNPPQEFLATYYNTCDIWFSPCIKEGFGLPILEAMKCKCPVVAFKNGGLDSYLINDHNCKIVKTQTVYDSAKTLSNLINQYEIKKKIVDNGYKLANKFTWENSTNKFIKVLEDCLR